jgi:hypothetical protein
MPTVNRCYRILGVPPGASKDEIKRAYRDLVNVWHPDRFADNERLQRKAQDNLKRINEAYATLRDHIPPPGAPRRSRLSETFSAIVDLGDMMRSSVAGFRIDDLHQGDPLHKPKPGHRPQGFSLVGLRRPRVPRRRQSSPLVWVVVAAAVVLAVVIGVVFVFR